MKGIETYLKQGDKLRNEGKWKEAREFYQKVVELEPDNWLAYHHLGDSLLSLEQGEEAIQSYQRCLKIKNDFVWSYYNYGVALLKLGKPEDAFKWHQKLTEINPEFWELNSVDYRIQHQIGDFWFEHQRWDNARIAYNRAIQLNQNSDWSYINLGRVLQKIGDLEKAIDVLHQVINIRPGLSWSYLYLADILSEVGNVEKSLEYYLKLVQLNPEQPEGIYQKIINVVNLNSEQPAWIYQSIFSHLIKIEQHDKAVQFISNISENSSISLELSFTLFHELIREGNQHTDFLNWLNAITYYKTALQLQPESADFWLYLNLGKALINLNEHQEALGYLRKAFEKDADNIEGLSLLGIALLNQEEWEEGEGVYQRIVEQENDNFLVYHNLADSYLGQGKYEQAKNTYQKAINLNPNYALSYHHLGDALGLAKLWDEAIGAYEQALKLTPEDDTLVLKLKKARLKAHFSPQISVSQVWYIVGEGSISAYYRVEHQVEMLKEQGYKVSQLNSNQLDKIPWEKYYAPVIVIFRATYNETLNEFVAHYKKRGSVIVFDIDDYVFELKIANEKYVDGIRLIEKPQRLSLYQNWVTAMRDMIEKCEYCTASTRFLVERLKELGKEAYKIENGFDLKMLELAAKAEQLRRERVQQISGEKIAGQDIIRIGYGSGTLTHQRDFQAALMALQDLLAKHQHIILTIVGLFEVDEFPELKDFRNRIEIRELVPHEQLFEEISRFDINLAPLEVGNPYCDAKSELKYIQAGILSIPTVASPTATYCDAIEEGKNGFLAHNSEEWFWKLDQLITSAEFRQQIGNQAKQDVLDRYYHSKKNVVKSVFDYLLKDSLKTAASQYENVIGYNLKYRTAQIQGCPVELSSDQLTINWIFPAFASCSGGISTAFRIVKYLVSQGHINKIWIHDPEGGKTPEHYRNLIEAQYHGVEVTVDFVPKDLDLIYGDAAIATDFASSLVARGIRQVNQRFYFIQDHEAEFNPTSFRSYVAQSSYTRDFVALSCGAWLHSLMKETYGMESVQWELASDPDYYSPPPPNHQRIGNRIAFYCQEAKPRRVTDLGVLAFEVLSRKNVEFHVDFYGEKEFIRALPYSYFHHGLLSHDELSELYQTATIGLVFSGTNYSIVPREMMACCLPVIEIASPSSTLSLGNSGAILVPPDPYELAERLEELLTNPSYRDKVSAQGLEHTSQYSWVKSAKIVEEALMKYCRSSML